MQGAKSGMTDVCKLYIEHGADVDVCTVVGGCCFLGVGGWAAMQEEVGIVGGRRQSLEQIGHDRYNDQMVIDPGSLF